MLLMMNLIDLSGDNLLFTEAELLIVEMMLY